MIRVLIVDDHEAVRAGLHGLLRSEPGIVPVGAAAGDRDLWPLLARTRPDVVILDFHLPGRHGLLLCRRLKATLPPPRVLIYSAFADESLTLPATLAGADAIVDKGGSADELFDAIRTLGREGRALPPVTPRQLELASAVLDPEDLPLVGMILEGTPSPEIAKVLGMAPEDVGARAERIVSRLVSAPA